MGNCPSGGNGSLLCPYTGTPAGWKAFPAAYSCCDGYSGNNCPWGGALYQMGTGYGNSINEYWFMTEAARVSLHVPSEGGVTLASGYSESMTVGAVHTVSQTNTFSVDASISIGDQAKTGAASFTIGHSWSTTTSLAATFSCNRAPGLFVSITAFPVIATASGRGYIWSGGPTPGYGGCRAEKPTSLTYTVPGYDKINGHGTIYACCYGRDGPESSPGNVRNCLNEKLVPIPDPDPYLPRSKRGLNKKTLNLRDARTIVFLDSDGVLRVKGHFSKNGTAIMDGREVPEEEKPDVAKFLDKLDLKQDRDDKSEKQRAESPLAKKLKKCLDETMANPATSSGEKKGL